MKRAKGMPARAWMLLVIAIGVAGLAACGEPDPEPQARPIPVKLATIGEPGERVRQYPGRVAASERSELAFRVSGQLVELPVRDGQRVNKGDLLARLDSRDFRNELEQRRADAKLAENQYRRGRTLSEREMIADAEFDELTARHDQTQAALGLARDNLSYTRLTAPYDGVIASTAQENHQYVQAQEPVLYLQSSDSLEVHFSVSENVITQALPLSEDFRARVVFPGVSDEQFPARYKEHETRPGSTQAYTIVLSVPAPDQLVVLPGMSVAVQVDQASLRGGAGGHPSVPVEAVFNGDGEDGARVWRFDGDNGTVHAQPVVLGEVSGAGVAVRQGLSPGDRVVVAGVHRLEEGQPVRELSRERGL